MEWVLKAYFEGFQTKKVSKKKNRNIIVKNLLEVETMVLDNRKLLINRCGGIVVSTNEIVEQPACV